MNAKERKREKNEEWAETAVEGRQKRKVFKTVKAREKSLEVKWIGR